MRTAETHPKPHHHQPPRLSCWRGGNWGFWGVQGFFGVFRGNGWGRRVPAPRAGPGLLRGTAQAGVVLALGRTAPRGWKWPQMCPCGLATGHGHAPLVGSCHGTQRLLLLVRALCPTSLAVTSWRGLSTLLGAAVTPAPSTPCLPSPGVPAVPLGEEGPPASLQLPEPHWYSVPAQRQLAGWEQSDSGDR